MRFLLAAALCAGLISAASAQNLSPRVEQALSYLPPQSETLAVESGPIVVPIDKEKELENWRNMGIQSSQSIMPANLQLSVVASALAGRTIELSLEARSNFRPPKGLGLMPYDGSGLIYLKPQAGQTRDLLKSKVWKKMKRVTLAGQQVGVFEEKREYDLWRIYVAVPRPDLIVLATDRASMITTLARMQRPNLTDRAFPSSWSGWKLVDTNAPFWAIRRLDLPGSVGLLGPRNRDPKARAFVIYSRTVKEAATPQWIMKYDGSPKLIRDFYAGSKGELKGTVSQIAGTQITQFISTSPDGYFTFYALGLLGTGIYL